MTDAAQTQVAITEAFESLSRLLHDAPARHLDAVHAAVACIVSALEADGKVLVFGNGGSAAEAQHLAAELVGRFVRERRALPAIALSTDTSILTAVGNDYGFDRVFARQIEAIGRRGDVAMGISTSGESANVVRAVETARSRGLQTIGLTGGDGGALGRVVDVHVNVPGRSTARVQEVQLVLLHVICELVERRFASARQER